MAGFIFENIDWECFQNCVEDCREKSFSCIAKCLFLCTKTTGPDGDGGSAFLNVLKVLENIAIGIEENPTVPVTELMPSLVNALERYQVAVRRRRKPGSTGKSVKARSAKKSSSKSGSKKR